MINWIKSILGIGKGKATPITLTNKAPQKQEPEKNIAPKTIKYIINDPTTSDEIIDVVPPNPCQLKMNINGYLGGGYDPHTLQGQAAGCYVTINTAAKYLISNTSTKKNMTKWAAVNILNVNPRAGKDFNAFYDRGGLKFFYDNDPILKKIVYTSESADVVAHEFGHAYLDILRPDLWSAQSYEAWAFHESFGDMVAIMNIMQYDRILEKAIKQTSGSMSTSSIISRLAEELGKALSDVSGDKSYAFSLRDAVNDFTYLPPSMLKDNEPNNKMSRECHSYSRVWTGTWYECMIGFYKQNLTEGMSQIVALKAARDTAAKLILHACQYADTVNFFTSTAQQMLHHDKVLNNSKYNKVMMDVFIRRKIIKPEIKLLSSTNYTSIIKSNKNLVQDSVTGGFIWRTQSLQTMSFGSEVSVQSGLSKPFSISLPYESVYIFDNNKTLLYATETSNEDIQENAKMCINYLQSKNLIGNNDKSIFDIKDGKLIRKKINGCKCHPNNACNPNSPEYGKPWKGENNAGAGSKGITVDCNCEQPEPKPESKMGCYVATKSCSSGSTRVCQNVSRRVC